jgi:hypothetical protein
MCLTNVCIEAQLFLRKLVVRFPVRKTAFLSEINASCQKVRITVLIIAIRLTS